MSELNVLYAADNNYAPFLGVSMYSLFKNNTNIDLITVYAILDKVSEENCKKLKETANDFHRNFIVIDATEINNKIAALGIPMYRGSYTTNYRLFFNLVIKSTVKSLLYIDSDTIVCGNLQPLLNLDMKNSSCAVVLDPLGIHYKKIIGFSNKDTYFNAGVMFIDVVNWNKNQCTEKLLNHVKTARSKYCNPDQDLLNITLKDNYIILSPKYNLMPVHLAYKDKSYFKFYRSSNYYSSEELQNAREAPVIIHTYRFLGEFPWHKGNLHPSLSLFDQYLSESKWKDYIKSKKKLNILFIIEKFLYRILPRHIFLLIFSCVQFIMFYNQNRKLKDIK